MNELVAVQDRVFVGLAWELRHDTLWTSCSIKHGRPERSVTHATENEALARCARLGEPALFPPRFGRPFTANRLPVHNQCLRQRLEIEALDAQDFGAFLFAGSMDVLSEFFDDIDAEFDPATASARELDEVFLSQNRDGVWIPIDRLDAYDTDAKLEGFSIEPATLHSIDRELEECALDEVGETYIKKRREWIRQYVSHWKTRLGGDAPQVSPMSGVYLTHAVNTDRVKIGRSKDIEARVASLGTESPYELQLSAVPSTNPEHECAFHKRFASERIKGEWFRLNGELRSLVSNCYLSEFTLNNKKLRARELAE